MKSEESAMKKSAIKVIFGLILCLLSFSIYLMFADSKTYRANIPISLDNVTFTSIKACNIDTEVTDYQQLINEVQFGMNISQVYYEVFEREAKKFIETYQELQDFEIKLSGDVNKQTRIESDLEVCQTTINNTKFMYQQLLKDQSEQIQNYTQQKNDIEIKLGTDKQKLDNQTNLQETLVIKLKGLQMELQRRKTNYQEEKNKTITADKRKQREEEIQNRIKQYRKIIQDEEKDIAQNLLLLENTEKQLNESQLKIAHLQESYNYAKDLQNSFNSYIKHPQEDVQVINYIQQASEMLKERVEIQKKLLQEKNETQQQINQQVYQVTTALQKEYEETIAVISECSAQKKCAFQKPITEMTMSELNKEVKSMAYQISQINAQIQSYSQLTIQFKEFIESSQKRKGEAQERLALSIEEQNQLANMGKAESLQDQLNQIDKLQKQIEELTLKIKDVKTGIEELNTIIEPQQQEINSIDLSLNDTTLNYNNKLQEKEKDLKKELKVCLGKRKIYEKYHKNQDNVSKYIEDKRKLLKIQIQQLQIILSDMKKENKKNEQYEEKRDL